MGGKQERKQFAATNVRNAEKLLTTFQELFTKTDIMVSQLDPQKPDDQRLALEIAMRGKNEEEYFSIVDGLSFKQDAEEDEQKKTALIYLTSQIMDLGERILGIDWS
jgi:hypothetical protein